MKIQAALNEGFKVLSALGIDTAMLDSTVLLAESMELNKEQLFTRLNEELPAACYSIFRTYLRLREAGQPVAYIRKKKEFFGLEFYVDNRVLIPRPDTELLVETVSVLLQDNPGYIRLHDLCTGSGCIPIALKILFPRHKISASDISPFAAEVFEINCRKILSQPLPFILSDLFAELEGPFDILTANPPYLKAAEYGLMREKRWPEPRQALEGGPDGLEVSENLIRQAPDFIKPGGFLVMESGFDCMEKLKYILDAVGFVDINVKEDLGGRQRVITGKRP